MGWLQSGACGFVILSCYSVYGIKKSKNAVRWINLHHYFLYLGLILQIENN